MRGQKRFVHGSFIRWVIRIPCARVKWTRQFDLFRTYGQQLLCGTKNVYYPKGTSTRAQGMMINHITEEPYASYIYKSWDWPDQTIEKITGPTAENDTFILKIRVRIRPTYPDPQPLTQIPLQRTLNGSIFNFLLMPVSQGTFSFQGCS